MWMVIMSEVNDDGDGDHGSRRSEYGADDEVEGVTMMMMRMTKMITIMTMLKMIAIMKWFR